MSSQFTFDETLKDCREFVSATAYPEFKLQVYENDGGIGISIDVSNRKGGPREPVVIGIDAEHARQLVKALQDAIVLTRR